MFNPRNTIVRQVNPAQPDAAAIAEAANILRCGGLVAFPTETVYGLGANALDPNAVRGIFEAKGRPPNNPVIVHVADALSGQLFARDWPEHAAALAKAFWPGSLTLVVNKQPMVPDIATAGGPTVGLRVPAHPVALTLLRAADIPIAAPSANLSTQISPTAPEHVLMSLDGKIEMLLDAGATSGGIESTVVDLTVSPPRLLRPGLITVEQIESVIGPIDATGYPAATQGHAQLRSPGLLERHYAPKAKVILAESFDETVGKKLAEVNHIGWLRLNSGAKNTVAAGAEGQRRKLTIIEMSSDPFEYAARLYAALHELDGAKVDAIVVDLPPTGDAWRAIQDRLKRASHS